MFKFVVIVLLLFMNAPIFHCFSDNAIQTTASKQTEMRVYITAHVIPTSSMGIILGDTADGNNNTSNLDFGEVRAVCTLNMKPNIQCEQRTLYAEYTSKINLNINSLNGANTRVVAYRQPNDNFNPQDGIVIEDHKQSIVPLAANKPILISEKETKGISTKKLGIRIRQRDQGNMNSMVRLVLETF